MSGTTGSIARSAAQLRQEFDRSFAVAHPESTGDVSDFLAARVAGDSYALPIEHLASVVAAGCIVRLPGAIPGLLGIAAVRNVAIPVYSLARLLGAAAAEAGWLVLLRSSEPVALAVDGLDGHLRLSRDEIAEEGTRTPRPHLQGAARRGDALLPIVDIPSLIVEMRRRARSSDPPEEEER